MQNHFCFGRILAGTSTLQSGNGRTHNSRTLTNWQCHLTTSLLSAGGPFQFPPPISGTVFLHISYQHCRSRFSGSVLRLFFSGAPTLTELSRSLSLHSTANPAVTLLHMPH